MIAIASFFDLKLQLVALEKCHRNCLENILPYINFKFSKKFHLVKEFLICLHFWSLWKIFQQLCTPIKCTCEKFSIKFVQIQRIFDVYDSILPSQEHFAQSILFDLSWDPKYSLINLQSLVRLFRLKLPNHLFHDPLSDEVNHEFLKLLFHILPTQDIETSCLSVSSILWTSAENLRLFDATWNWKLSLMIVAEFLSRRESARLGFKFKFFLPMLSDPQKKTFISIFVFNFHIFHRLHRNEN